MFYRSAEKAKLPGSRWKVAKIGNEVKSRASTAKHPVSLNFHAIRQKIKRPNQQKRSITAVVFSGRMLCLI